MWVCTTLIGKLLWKTSALPLLVTLYSRVLHREAATCLYEASRYYYLLSFKSNWLSFCRTCVLLGKVVLRWLINTYFFFNILYLINRAYASFISSLSQNACISALHSCLSVWQPYRKHPVYVYIGLFILD